jgi:hypothetical protein
MVVILKIQPFGFEILKQLYNYFKLEILATHEGEE